MKIQYNRNRYYDYNTGRWLTHDPLRITPNCRKPNEFRPFGLYEDSLNLYEMLGSNPLLGTDPWGLLGWGSIGDMIGKLPGCDFAKKFFEVLKKGMKQLPGLPSAMDPIVFGGGYPYGHCSWSCDMVRKNDEDYARDMGEKKEELDNAVADWADTIPICVWNNMGSWLRQQIGLWVCSAGQESDERDNEAGIDCGLNSPLPCWQCCILTKKIGRGTKDGTVERPFGERCKGRYLKEAIKKFGPVEVEDTKRFSSN